MYSIGEVILTEIVEECVEVCIAEVRKVSHVHHVMGTAKSLTLQILVLEFHYKVQHVATILGNHSPAETLRLKRIEAFPERDKLYMACVKAYKARQRKTAIMGLPAGLTSICSACRWPASAPDEGTPLSECCRAELVLTRKTKSNKNHAQTIATAKRV